MKCNGNPVKHLQSFIWVLACFGFLCTVQAGAQADRPQTVNIYVLRTAEQLQGPHVLTYRVAEWEQLRGRWIPFDVGYYDTGYGQDQMWFAAAGIVPAVGPRFRWEQEIYVLQEAGPQSQNRRTLWIWPVLYFQPRPRISAQIAAYPTIPLDRAQHKSYDIDRAKLEWDATTHWRAGVGYSGGLCGGATWHSEPFLTVTRSTRAGRFEFWLQSTSGGGQVQMRYALVRSEH
jgi:hypothetical protein